MAASTRSFGIPTLRGILKTTTQRSIGTGIGAASFHRYHNFFPDTGKLFGHAIPAGKAWSIYELQIFFPFLSQELIVNSQWSMVKRETSNIYLQECKFKAMGLMKNRPAKRDGFS